MISYFSTLKLNLSFSPSFDTNGQSVNPISVTRILTHKILGSSFSKFSALENDLESFFPLSLFPSQIASTTTHQLLILFVLYLYTDIHIHTWLLHYSYQYYFTHT